MANSLARLSILFLALTVFTAVALAQENATPTLLSRTPPSPSSPTHSPHGATTEVETAKQRSWYCVAKPSTSDAVLIGNLQFVCAMLDCKPIQTGGPCFEPDTYLSHASWAMNLYYKTIPEAGNCYFNGSGIITTTDPSYGNCKYD